MSINSKLTVFPSFQPATENSCVLRVPASHVVTLRKCLRHISVLKPSNLWHVLQHWRSIFDPNPGKISHESSTRLWKRTGHPKTPQIVSLLWASRCVPFVANLSSNSLETASVTSIRSISLSGFHVPTCPHDLFKTLTDLSSASVSPVSERVTGLMIVTKSMAQSPFDWIRSL